jgi:diketogulonate reductase-like aldo/keto reductase
MDGTKRRRFLQALGATALAGALPARAAGVPDAVLRRPIPGSGEPLPVIGMGTWLTFDVGQVAAARRIRGEVLRAFFEGGGALIDSSPMYGSSEEVLGVLLAEQRPGRRLFAATKVWTVGRSHGIAQMEESRRLWGVARFDLMQIHNLVDWETHAQTLRQWKAEGKVRYIGITTSHGRRHDRLEQALMKVPFDFVQFTYNIVEREVEQRLLPLAAERRIAVIINRPFDGGALFRRASGKPLPAWAAEFDCRNWAQFFLKFIVSHPAVTCAIPATSQPAHMLENMGAAYGRLPDATMRRRMIDYWTS